MLLNASLMYHIALILGSNGVTWQLVTGVAHKFVLSKLYPFGPSYSFRSHARQYEPYAYLWLHRVHRHQNLRLCSVMKSKGLSSKSWGHNPAVVESIPPPSYPVFFHRWSLWILVHKFLNSFLYISKREKVFTRFTLNLWKKFMGCQCCCWDLDPFLFPLTVESWQPYRVLLLPLDLQKG